MTPFAQRDDLVRSKRVEDAGYRIEPDGCTRTRRMDREQQTDAERCRDWPRTHSDLQVRLW